MGNEGPKGGKKHESYHPSVESPEDIERAKTIAEEIMQRAGAAADTTAGGLIDTVRHMHLEQIAHALLNLKSAAEPFPERDIVVAKVFLEKYTAPTRH